MGEPFDTTMGLPGMPTPCNLGNRYSLAILGEWRISKFFVCLLINLRSNIEMMNSLISAV